MEKKFDVICIGAALIDLVARVDRHPLEDDEVFVHNLELFSGGAAANTAYDCSKLGLTTAFIGKLGLNDEFGSKIIRDFDEVSVDISFVKYSNETGTGTAYIALNKQGDRRIYAYSGAANLLSKWDIKPEELNLSKLVYLSSLKNFEPFLEAARISKENNIPVILNPGMLIIDQGLDKISELLKKIDIFILSRREFKILLNVQEDLNENVIKKNAELFWNLGIKVVIITLGKDGAFLLIKNCSELIPSIAVKKVIDTTGAGDAFSAGFIFGFVKNLSYKFEDLKKCVKLGNFVAGNCVQELGARNGIPTEKEISVFYSNLKPKTL